MGCLLSPFIGHVLSKQTGLAYGLPNVKIETNLVRTDRPSNTTVRSPGEPQAVAITERIIQHLAQASGLSAHSIRERNLFTSAEDMAKVAADPTNPEMDKFAAALEVDASQKAVCSDYGILGVWTSTKEKADFAAKEKAVAEFNASHRWRKRGLSLTPTKFMASGRQQQVLLCAYTDGTFLISCDGSEIGQGLNTKVIQFAAYYLSQIVPGCTVPMDSIRVAPVGVDKVAHGSITGGSSTSENCCLAVKDAVEKLAKSMESHQAKLKEAGKPYDLKTLLEKASGDTELQVSGKCQKPPSYAVWGAAASEVEVDVLTGETQI